MSDSDLGSGGHGQEEAALLSAWISQEESRNSKPPDALSIAAMVQYLCSTQSASEASQVEQALVSSRVLRGQLREVRAVLDALQAGTWEQAANHSTDAGLSGEVARGWSDVLSHRPALSAQGRQNWQERGWERTLREVGEGVPEAQAAWTALLALGDRLKAALTTPSLLAPAPPGASDQEYLQGFPDGITVRMEGRVQTGGDLNVAAHIRDAAGKPVLELDGRILFLALSCGGAELPIASRPVERDSVEWKLEGLGSALGQPEGPLPASLFAVSLDKERRSASVYSYTLQAEFESEGGTTSGVTLPVEMRGQPRWEQEIFSIEIALPSRTRLACPHHKLLLEVAVAPGCWQCLGEWATQDWDDSPRELTAECPGSMEVEAVFPALIRARLRPIIAAP